MSRMSWQSLRARLFLTFLLAIVPALGLAFYNGIQARRQAAAAAEQELLQLVHVAAIDQAEVIRGAHQLLTLLALILLRIVGDKIILRPVHTLMDTTDRLAAGDLGARTGLQSTSGELGQLAVAFDRMADHLEERSAEREEALRTVSILLGVSEKLNAMLDVDGLMEALVKEAVRLVIGDGGCYGLRTAEGLVCRSFVRDDNALPFDYTFAAGHGIPGWVLAHKAPYLTNDATTDPIIIPELRQQLGFQSVLCTPILDNDGEVIGFFEVVDKKDAGGFTEADSHRLVGLSQIASIALQNAWLFEQAQQDQDRLRRLNERLVSAQEDERRRLSRELHDEAGQALTALKLNLSMLQRRLPEELAALRREMAEAVVLVDETAEQIRRLSQALRPPMLDRLGLDSALESFCQDFARQTGLVIHYAGCPVPPVPDDVSMSYYRFLQEALNNVAKHAGATRVVVELWNRDQLLTLSVQDDGRGFESVFRATSSDQLEGIGLVGLQERFELLGGRLEIESYPTQGTRLAAVTPIKGMATFNVTPE